MYQNKIYVGTTGGFKGNLYGFTGTTGINEFATVQDFRLSPNPAQDYFQITFKTPTPGSKMTLELVDILGKTMMRRPLSAQSLTKETIAVSQYPKGLYLVVLREEASGMIVVQEKVIVR